MSQIGKHPDQLKAVSSPAGVYDAIQASKAEAAAGADAVEAKFIMMESAASVGGAADEDYTVTGLLTSDVILAVTQSVGGANDLPLLGYAMGMTNGHLTGSYSADPGAGARVKVLVKRG